MKKWIWMYLTAIVFISSGFLHAKEANIHLTIATEAHPHVRALLDGRVKVQGCDIEFSTHPAVSISDDIESAKHFDVVEVDIVPYLQKYSAGSKMDYMLIPVFLHRGFQLRNIFIRTDRGIQVPSDLRGKKVGVSERALSASVWVRGVFHSSWSIKPGDMTVSQLPKASAALQKGEVDAAFSMVEPSRLDEKDAHVARLFKDYYEVESQVFKETRVFPILTVLAIKKSIAEENPWISEALFLAFSEAKKKAMEDMTLPLPWEGPQLAETEKLMGKNFWSYGVKSNPKTLSALFRYAAEQNVLNKPVEVDEVFDPSTLLLIEP